MSQPIHSYGPACKLGHTVAFSGSKGDDDMPPLKAHFFYSSYLPIDDPLSAAPIPSSSDAKSIKYSPQPYSTYDNNALEEAWLGLSSSGAKKSQLRKSLSPATVDRRWRKNRNKSPEHGIQPFTKSSGNVNPHPGAKTRRDNFKHQKPSKADEYQKREEEGRNATAGESEQTKSVNLDLAPSERLPILANMQPKEGEKTLKVDQDRTEEDCIAADAESGQQMALEKDGSCVEEDCIAADGQSSKPKASDEGLGQPDNESVASNAQPTHPDQPPTGHLGAAFIAADAHSSQPARRNNSEATKPSVEQSPCRSNEKNATGEHLRQSEKKELKPSKERHPLSHAKNESSAQTTQSQQLEEQGNPLNRYCEDLHHVGLDTQIPSCCGDFERNDRTDHKACLANGEIDPNLAASGEDKDSNVSKRGKGMSKGKQKVDFDGNGAAQGDGADDGRKLVLLDVEELSSQQHKAFEKHGQSSEHRKFGEHLDSKHQGLWSSRQNVEAPTQPLTHTVTSLRSSDVKIKEASEYASRSRVGMSASIPKSNLLAEKDVRDLTSQTSDAPHIVAAQAGDAGTTGSPFVKLPSRSSSPQAPEPETADSRPVLDDRGDSYRKSRQRGSTETETVLVPGCKANKSRKGQVDVLVGVSRLHFVQLPVLQMSPIYWSPIHDIAAVTRGTWFYKDTMYPVEPSVANQLELGYRELRVWSQTWNDELNSAVEVGAAGEERIAHDLWPQEEEPKPKSQKGPVYHPLTSDPYCAAMCFHGEAAAEGNINCDESDQKSPEPSNMVKRHSKSKVIYKDSQNAFILKPNLQPSAYFGRKPLQKIRKGTTVGIHVVRGFDWKTWHNLHPSKKTTATKKAEEKAPVAGDADARGRNVCIACRAQEEREKVTDLVFVIHGIGQKLSESLESFHFTHAINGFRRSINVELGNEGVQRVLSKDLGGVMVLPINWRSNVSFDEDGPKKADKSTHGADFTMKDITPSTIPAVRDFIEKVMLDIPYWMSIHKPKMIQAVITEANRVYRLWCRNNPEFHKEGRVHIIAHSLGSTMALDILSKQPTTIPRFDPYSKKANTKCFDFKTTNLFFCGSPVGFFLYLERGYLIPRKGQAKPGAEHGDEQDKEIVGEAGTYGCLAVDNVYNIIHPEDPIAYQVGPTVDTQYAASLRKGQVPSARTGFFESIGNAVRSITPGMSSSEELPVGQVSKPAGLPRMPSQLEMEVHDFTREENAEKKFILLNDNGQIDYFLSSDSGPLSLQYITMLSAHSAYWENHDFIRMIVVEVGRKPGQKNCLPSMKAVKVGHKPLKGS